MTREIEGLRQEAVAESFLSAGDAVERYRILASFYRFVPKQSLLA
jgi:hypothetical protein